MWMSISSKVVLVTTISVKCYPQAFAYLALVLFTVFLCLGTIVIQSEKSATIFWVYCSPSKVHPWVPFYTLLKKVKSHFELHAKISRRHGKQFVTSAFKLRLNQVVDRPIALLIMIKTIPVGTSKTPCR